MQRRIEFEQASERLARQEDQYGIERDARGHRAPFVRNEHRLAEDLSRPVACDGPRAVDDVDSARNDQVERVGLVARLVDRLALGERGLAEETRDVLALRFAEAAKCGLRVEDLPAARTQHRGTLTAAELIEGTPTS